MSPFLFYLLFSAICYNTVRVKGNSPRPLVAGKPLHPPPPPPPPEVVVPPNLPYHLNFSTAVEGVVFCASCSSLSGFNKSTNAAPLHGAAVKLLCFHRASEQAAKNHPIWKRKQPAESEAEAKTDEKGYFLIRAAEIKPGLINWCRVYVSPPKWCSKALVPSASKKEGIIPKFERVIRIGLKGIYLYSAGFFEFEPFKTGLCPH